MDPFDLGHVVAQQSGSTAACGDDQRLICEWVFERTNSSAWAQLADWFLDRPLRVLFILVLAWVVSRVLRRVVRRFVEGVTRRTVEARHDEGSPQLTPLPMLVRTRSEQQRLRAKQRGATLGSMLDGLVGIVVWVTALFLILGEVGVSLGPLIASAGIAGIAVGFGAQTVVRDFLAGMFVLIEDQYGVGDVIDVGEVTGNVEEVGLRTTRIRDVHGVFWTVPNGEITRVGNYSQLWSKSIFDVEVAYETDIDHAVGVIKQVLDEVWVENTEPATIIEEPEVQGVEAFKESSVVIRAVVKTDPNEQWAVARKIRGRLKKALDEEGISMPYPQRTVWLRNDDDYSQTGRSRSARP